MRKKMRRWLMQRRGECHRGLLELDRSRLGLRRRWVCVFVYRGRVSWDEAFWVSSSWFEEWRCQREFEFREVLRKGRGWRDRRQWGVSFFSSWIWISFSAKKEADMTTSQ